MAYPQGGHRLSFLQGFDNTTDTVGNIIAKTVIFTGVNLKYKTGIFLGNGNKLTDDTAQFQNIVDFFADDVAPGNVGICGNDSKAAKIFS